MLKETYHQTFKRADVLTRGKNTNLLNNIAVVAQYKMGDSFGVNPKITSYVFTAQEYELDRYYDILPFVTGHETFHALQYERMKMGWLNTAMVTNFSVLALNKTAEYATKHVEKINELLEEGEPSTRAIQAHAAVIKLLKLGNDIATNVFETNLKTEENMCDAFALKLFPKTNLTRFEEYLNDKNIVTVNPSQLDTHPDNKKRIERLLTLKNEIL